MPRPLERATKRRWRSWAFKLTMYESRVHNSLVPQHEIYNSGFAAASYLKSIGFDKKVYLIGEEFDEVGIKHRGLTEHAKIPEPLSNLDFIDYDPEIGAVVVGLDRSITYAKAAFASYHLQADPNCLFVATNDDQTYPSGVKGNVPGAGSIVAMIEAASGRKPIVCGKPSPQLFNTIRNKTIMVGDRLSTDIKWGRTSGISTLLVLTGVSTEEDLSDPNNDVKPHFVLESLGNLKDLLAGQ